MPQVLLPLIPEGSTPVNDLVSVVREAGTWSYFVGVMPVYQHAERDRKSFRLFTAMMVHQGSCKQIEIIRTFGVSKNSVQRAVNLYADGGIEAFFVKRKGRGATVFTEEVIEKAQQLLDEGCSRREVATTLDIKYDTLRKTINLGRLREPGLQTQHASDKSDRKSTL